MKLRHSSTPRGSPPLVCGVGYLPLCWRLNNRSQFSHFLRSVMRSCSSMASSVQNSQGPSVSGDYFVLGSTSSPLIGARNSKSIRHGRAPTEFTEIPLPFPELWATGPIRNAGARALRLTFPAGSPLCVATRPRKVILNLRYLVDLAWARRTIRSCLRLMHSTDFIYRGRSI